MATKKHLFPRQQKLNFSWQINIIFQGNKNIIFQGNKKNDSHILKRQTVILALQVILGMGYMENVDIWSVGCIMGILAAKHFKPIPIATNIQKIIIPIATKPSIK
jgi:hypothetical protein